MAGIIATISGWVGGLYDWFACIFTTLPCFFYNMFYSFLWDVIQMGLIALAWIPIPSAVATWSWPNAGPLVGVLGEVGFAQATAIVAGAMTIKFLLRLIPFVRL